MEKALFVSDIATRSMKLASRLSGTVSLLQVLERLYKCFDVGAQSVEEAHMSPQDSVHKVTYVNDDITGTVSEVKQRYNIKETTATKDPAGNMSDRTQVSIKRLKKGMRRLQNSIASINNDYLEDIGLCTLLTIVVENLFAVSHFKHKTFTTL